MGLRTMLHTSAARLALATAATALWAGIAVAQSTSPTSAPTAQDYLNAASDNASWILPAKSYSGNRYVTSDQITPENASGLQNAWTFKLSDDGPTETAPIVWHGTMYVTSAHNHVYALDAATGKLKWEFQDNPHVISFAANRGIGLMDGNVYMGTLDGHLIALNAETGQKVFDIVGVKDTKNSFYTMAPMPYHNAATGQDMLLLGVSNGDWGGIGNIAAFDPKDGHRLWQWNTIPGPGEPGHDTWPGDSWKRGGGSVWSGVAIDPATETLYIDAGNPGPDFLASARRGNNLYTDSIVALDISGSQPKMKWYHQFIAEDTHDWDPAAPPLLFQGKRNGQTMELVASGDKAGNFWLLDAKTGDLLDHTAVSFQHNQDTQPDLKGNVACPNTNGGIEFNGMAFDPDTNTVYVPSVNECGLFKSLPQTAYIAGQFYLGGAFPTYVGPNTGWFNAINVDTGVFNWRQHLNLPAAGGALVTKTGLVFSGELDGKFDAFDAKTGKVLWSAETGSPIIAPPMSFEQDGKQYVVVASGEVGNQKVPELEGHPTKGSMISAFTLK